jgi:hypothetical protein
MLVELLRCKPGLVRETVATRSRNILHVAWSILRHDNAAWGIATCSHFTYLLATFVVVSKPFHLVCQSRAAVISSENLKQIENVRVIVVASNTVANATYPSPQQVFLRAVRRTDELRMTPPR